MVVAVDTSEDIVIRSCDLKHCINKLDSDQIILINVMLDEKWLDPHLIYVFVPSKIIRKRDEIR